MSPTRLNQSQASLAIEPCQGAQHFALVVLWESRLPSIDPDFALLFVVCKYLTTSLVYSKTHTHTKKQNVLPLLFSGRAGCCCVVFQLGGWLPLSAPRVVFSCHAAQTVGKGVEPQRLHSEVHAMLRVTPEPLLFFYPSLKEGQEIFSVPEGAGERQCSPTLVQPHIIQ